MFLFIAVQKFSYKKILPVIVLPSLGAILNGVLFGPATIFLYYFLPFIWIGNLILIYSFSQLVKYFPKGVDSPMVNTARIVAEKYPGFRPVFIGPCIVKKLESSEDYPELNIIVITYIELLTIFQEFNIKELEKNINDHFDIEEKGMPRIYSIDGGLSHSGGLTAKIVSYFTNYLEVLKNFEADPKIKLLDILNCDGGCIGGPGIKSSLSKKEKEKVILKFWQENDR
ncbi:hypothetical protein COY88_02950 [Candidatus Roizmanbacteria bacterium CG_4_10_14_0_8_um_filter_35_28]|uniref:Iron hydrogenase large subunit C-terminal domain-containing protein n=3 Tax=Candidatus Roizmaniibacteriota TaxID=1752723 RepID=A0A2M8F4C2_9BACT|nr:MAG: hypothetical protein COX47_02560 [Candidatus Roizmanbacteria bacterium CG23_combo_of_CG06-09_8_20_14_all_35_49]PIY70944.1 MAG: hypothetical protein COY88_02950 [Candidatus Roizmanbacteria bacterium CG_4_10_14_0_8_um_filter_35_28]PJC34135.1 MAG: hypothetical protein CO048_01065 [Candidatus Roizmanbacteria bacterium CG_4_9_14_0_2_um_filter_35_15]PJC82469.1 MAG: hypothetical protein CO006_03470 [Candidatus Roizmanbacteria bacterium CG_4_8_14_3_um_filter_35_14]